MHIGKLERVPLRELWKDEARGFTPWLIENMEILDETLELGLSPVEREKGAGAFLCDIFAEDYEGNKVVVECQLEKTDHDHFGKLLTYLTNLEAKSAIWISSEPRSEHVKAINWLNEVLPPDISIYLVRVEAVRIDDSPPAAAFTVVCEPSEEAKKMGKAKEELAERHIKRLTFWKQLLEKDKANEKIHENVSPRKDNWLATGAGKTGLYFSYYITMHSASVELTIDRGKDSEEENKKIFKTLEKKKDEIERDFTEPLKWDAVEGRRVCKIKWTYSKSGLKDEENWDELQNQMLTAMIRLTKSMKKHIRSLHI